MSVIVKPKQAMIKAVMVDGSWKVEIENVDMLRPRDMHRLERACNLAYRAALMDQRMQRAAKEEAITKLETVST